MTVWPLPRITFRELSAIEETRPVALLTSEAAWTELGSQLALPVIIQAEPDRYSGELFDYLAANLPTQVQVIYVVGQGAPLQAGKVIAAYNRKPLVVVPTALSSDMMLTPTAFVEREQEDATTLRPWVETGPASEVIIDWRVIEAAPHDRRGAGIVDVLSIITGLLDWRYAAQKGKNPPTQRFTPWAATVTAGLATQAIKSAAAIGEGREEGLHTLLNLMMIAVQLSNQLGHTRAREGSEHYLAQMVSSHASPNLEHADVLGPCLLFAAALHGQDPASLREAMESAGVRLDRLLPTDMRLTLDSLSAYLWAYNFPYSILNDLDVASDKVEAALQAAGLALLEDTWETPQEEEIPSAVEPSPEPPTQPNTPSDQEAPPLAEASAEASSQPDTGAESPEASDTAPETSNG